MKVDIDTIKMILSRAADIDDKRKAQIIEDILFEARQTDGETKPPKPKTAFLGIINDPFGTIAAAAPKGVEGWVVQFPEKRNPADILNELVYAAGDFNLTPKGLRMPIKTFAETLEFLPAKLAKEHGISIKTRERVYFACAPRRLFELTELGATEPTTGEDGKDGGNG